MRWECWTLTCQALTGELCPARTEGEGWCPERVRLQVPRNHLWSCPRNICANAACKVASGRRAEPCRFIVGEPSAHLGRWRGECRGPSIKVSTLASSRAQRGGGNKNKCPTKSKVPTMR